jgi:lactoylglutathione lyase
MSSVSVSSDVGASTARNKQTVAAYFAALDRGDLAALPGLFAADCRIHRPGLKAPLRGIAGIGSVVAGATERYSKFKTQIVSMIAEGDMVACRLTHHAEFKRPWPTRIGTFDVTGRPVIWHPLVQFRMQDGKVAEQWVCRDELGMLIDLEVLSEREGG